MVKKGRKKEKKNLPRPGIEPGTLQYVWFSAAGKSGYFDSVQYFGKKRWKKALYGSFVAAGKQAILVLCSTLAKKRWKKAL